MIRAAYYGTCSCCQHPIVPGAPIVIRKGEWICAGCASGGDER